VVFVIDSTIKGTISRSSVIVLEIYENISFPPISPTKNNDWLKKLSHSAYSHRNKNWVSNIEENSYVFDNKKKYAMS
jgi:hypothetical protein